MICTILKHVAFLLLMPVAVLAIVGAPLIVEVLDKAIEPLHEKRPLYEAAENTLPPCEF